ncbi:MAG: UDP-phosphate alpha-N-acetyl-D-fucosaminephosphotransferase [Leucobacter sp.]
MIATNIVVIAVLAAGTVLGLSLLLPVAVRPLLVRLGIMDVPNERSSHDRPVIRGLGLAVLIAMVVGGSLAVLLFSFGGLLGWQRLLLVVVGFTLSGLLGLREDLRGLSVPVRSAVLLLIALAFAVSLLVFDEGSGGAVVTWIAGVPISPIPLWAVIILVIYAVLFISSYINVANFMDGLNGISGFHGVIAGAAFGVVGWLTATPWLLIIGVVLAAGYLGFLPWNLTKPGAFLGDVGSYLLGGATAMTSFAALLSGVPFLATIGPMVIAFGDVAVTLVKRVRRGDAWYEPHKEHAYQRIQQLGYTHVQASAMTAACTAAASALGVLALFTGLWGTLALLVAGLAVLVFYLLLPRLLPPRALSPDSPATTPTP